LAVTSKEVAQRANVSPMTVSRVFSPRPGFPIAEKTRERVQAAALELGYRPNRLASALVTGRTNMVTLHIPELSPYHAQIVRTLQGLLAADDYEMIMFIDPFRVDQPDARLRERRPFPSDGVIAVDLAGTTGSDLLRQAGGTSAPPIVCVGTRPLDTDGVFVDLSEGVRQAVRHLVDRGARRIGYVVWDFVNRTGDARRDAYEGVIREAGLEPLYYPVSWPSRDAARAEIGALLDAGDRPDALFCFNDDLAIGVFRILQERGIMVPDDMLLCGCDGLSDAEYLAVPLTTVALPIEAMCATAWSLLCRRMDAPAAEAQQTTLNSRLIVRESTRRA
jgi:DNA-binding LacI/PurR family transcriptional regulator